jgi:hypothetical protein
LGIRGSGRDTGADRGVAGPTDAPGACGFNTRGLTCSPVTLIFLSGK